MCLLGSKCVDGQCCKPQCSGKQCGDDGCQGQCGQCPEGEKCKDGICIPPCKDGSFKPVEKLCSWKPIYKFDDPRGYLFYQEVNSKDFPLSGLRVEIRQYAPFNGPQGEGSFVISTDSYKKCAICLTYFEDCTSQGCAHVYLATEGTIEIEVLNGATSPFKAKLKDVFFKEAKIDKDWNTQIVKNGSVLCIDNHDIVSEKVELAVPEKECVEQGTGVTFDKNIADFVLTNCYGHEISLHGLCGKVKAMWIMLITAWCSVCAEVTPQVYKYYSDLKSKDPSKLGLWFVLGEDAKMGSIDQTECMEYAKNHGLNPAIVFYDSGWATTFKHIYPFGFTGVPYHILLDGDNMAYYWSSGAKGDINDALGGLLY